MKKCIFIGIFVLAGVITFFIVHNNRMMKQASLHIDQHLIVNRDTTITIVSIDSLDDLPPPVRRYLKFALGESPKRFSLAQFRHGGYININLDSNFYDHQVWKNLFVQNTVRLDQPAFFWQSMVHLGWEFWRKGWLRFDEEKTELYWTWMGTFPLVRIENEHLYRYALGQFLIQAPWYPTALLPSEYLSWQAKDDTSAFAIISKDGIQIKGEFHFDHEGRINRFITNDVARITKSGTVYEQRVAEYKYYEKKAEYWVPLRLINFWNTPIGRISDEDLRLDEIIYR